MSTSARIRNIEKKMSKKRESEVLGTPLIELSPEEKLTWKKGRPYPLLGSLLTNEVQKDIK